MKKLESTWYNMALVLTGIAVVAGAALGYVNSITAPTIEAIKAQQEKEAEQQVLNGQEGTAFKETETGFGGALTVMVGLAPDGKVLGYKVLESSETPGLGAKADFWFQKGEKGNIIGKTAGKLTVSKDGGDVDAITASTITSRAFLKCINAAYEELSKSNADGQSGASQQAGELNNNI
ncbi:MAG: FMN-binding protein [Bacteroidaceae bacterium]|nr:FMN-binding protein [Bacteroidaceae bacterium]MBQ9293841.1 FMN-binding protein [Bacteroidaceae bacterium]